MARTASRNFDFSWDGVDWTPIYTVEQTILRSAGWLEPKVEVVVRDDGGYSKTDSVLAALESVQASYHALRSIDLTIVDESAGHWDRRLRLYTFPDGHSFGMSKVQGDSEPEVLGLARLIEERLQHALTPLPDGLRRAESVVALSKAPEPATDDAAVAAPSAAAGPASNAGNGFLSNPRWLGVATLIALVALVIAYLTLAGTVDWPPFSK